MMRHPKNTVPTAERRRVSDIEKKQQHKECENLLQLQQINKHTPPL